MPVKIYERGSGARDPRWILPRKPGVLSSSSTVGGAFSQGWCFSVRVVSVRVVRDRLNVIQLKMSGPIAWGWAREFQEEGEVNEVSLPW